MQSQRARLYQIAYSDETWASVPKDFLALDNRANLRPDWAEYWPIRNFLLSETLDENALYGFVSPRFAEKLLCTAADIADFVASLPQDVDVAAFSPYFDFRVMFRNVFEQGEFFHPGLFDLSQRAFAEFIPGLNLHELTMSASNTIYCNYFAAKPHFWRKWLALGERIYSMAESSKHPAAPALNRGYAHRGANQAKVFVMERMVSLLLAREKTCKVALFGETTLSDIFPEATAELLQRLEVLKTRSLQGDPRALHEFYEIQHEILSGKSAKLERARLIAQSLEHGVAHAPSRGFEQWQSAPATMLYRQGQIGLGRLLVNFVCGR
ncbi:MAG TPA: hypothetical protein VIF60_21325 [Burkholderiaceae bacterium]|jgi:hypothetical protein